MCPRLIDYGFCKYLPEKNAEIRFCHRKHHDFDDDHPGDFF